MMEKIKWIYTKDRTPEGPSEKWSKPVIAWTDNYQVFELSYYNHEEGGFWERSIPFTESGAKKVIAWIPWPDH